MKLYKVALAPNPTKVMLYIAERAELGTNMDIEQITVNTVKGHHKEPDHLQPGQRLYARAAARADCGRPSGVGQKSIYGGGRVFPKIE